jgi:hypothetical protein
MKYLLTALCILSLSACTLHKVTDKQQLCDQAKRQEVLNNSSPSIDSYYLTNAQKSKLDQQVKDNC